MLKQPGVDQVDTEMLGGQDTMDELLRSKLEAVMSEQRSRSAAALDTVEWRGDHVPVHSARLRVAILRARELTEQLGARLKGDGGDLDVFLEVFSAYDEALLIVRQDLKEETTATANDPSLISPSPRAASLLALKAMLTFHKLRQTIERDRMMASAMAADLEDDGAETTDPKSSGKKRTRASDVVVMYEKLINNAEALGVAGGAESDKVLAMEVKFNVVLFKAFRVFFVAKAYSEAKQWVEAYVLYQRCLQNCEMCGSLIKQSGVANESTLARVRELSAMPARRRWSHTHTACSSWRELRKSYQTIYRTLILKGSLNPNTHRRLLF
eukprot:359842_1